MDDLDDPLDDLLRDSSAGKFKKPPTLGDELLPPSGSDPPAGSRKEKKSALLAELFGPSSSLTPSFDDYSFNKNSESTKSVTSLTLEDPKNSKAEGIVGGYVPSSASATVKARPASVPYQPSIESFQQPNNSIFGNYQIPKSSNLEIQQDLTTTGKKVLLEQQQQQLSTDLTPKHRNTKESVQQPSLSIFGNYQIPKTNLETESFKIQDQKDIPGIKKVVLERQLSTDLSTKESSSYQQQASNNYVSDHTRSYSRPQEQSIKIKDEFQSKVIPDEQTLASIKQILEDFSKSFCTQLQEGLGSSSKPEGLSEITSSLSELQKCVSTTSQSLLQASSSRNVELERRVSMLESRIDGLVQDNVQLRARLNEIGSGNKPGKDYEAQIEAHVKWTKEVVSRLEAQMKLQSHEEIRSLNDKFIELQNRIKTPTTAGDDVLQLLKSEVKWLERQKSKLKLDRKEHRLTLNEIQGKMHRMDTLSAVCYKNTLFTIYYYYFYFSSSFKKGTFNVCP